MLVKSKLFTIPLFASITIIFSLQIVLQSVPIAECIIVNRDAMCTCGCCHTISVCAANHGNGNNCKCQHDKDEETKIKFASNTVNDFVLTPITHFYVKYLAEI